PADGKLTSPRVAEDSGGNGAASDRGNGHRTRVRAAPPQFWPGGNLLMPVLSQEPFVSPDDLFTESGPPAIGEGHWYVLHTKPRAEKRLARELLSKGKSFSLPQHSRNWTHNGGKVTSHLPLFPSYVFLHGDEDARYTALKTNQVAYVIPVVDQRQLHN